MCGSLAKGAWPARGATVAGFGHGLRDVASDRTGIRMVRIRERDCDRAEGGHIGGRGLRAVPSVDADAIQPARERRMSKKEVDTRVKSDREKAHAEMLEAALARPGLREVMRVYQGWQDKDRGLDAYRAATKRSDRVTTTDHSNPC